ncbi:hypothetical protein GCM10011491_23570 [Brucella endophytica]|uniref:Uncharacterized protein n=1 Tax=Brucella endophytica TaxID=1963359 RepID=A0A916SE18_9HYPH|nr:hypothetical protein GCM10011491_23570 [Brucella endophytica]
MRLQSRLMHTVACSSGPVQGDGRFRPLKPHEMAEPPENTQSTDELQFYVQGSVS